MQVLRRRWVSVLVMTLLAVAVGLLYTYTASVTYRAQSSVFFSLTAGSSAADLVQGSTYAQNQVESFARLATTPAVLRPVIDELGLAESPAALADQVDASVPVGTVIVDVGVTDLSPQRAARLADAVVASLTDVVETIAPKDDAGKPTVRGTTVAPAQVPTTPASPKVPLDLGAAVVVGLLLGLVLAWLRETLETRVRDVEALAEVTDRPVIGTVGSWSARAGRRIVVDADPHSPGAESFRLLRTNLQFLRVADEAARDGERTAQVIALTSALAAEGKSTIASNLAATLAHADARVLLVDADLRRPSVAGLLGLEGEVGLTTVLAGQVAFEDVVQRWGPAGLDVMAAGAIPPNPAELLGSPAMHRLVGLLRAVYDYVVLDTAPVLPVADAIVLSRVADGTIVVAQAGRVRRGQLAHALQSLDQVSANVLGVVLNRLRREEHSYTYQQTPAYEQTSTRPADGSASRRRAGQARPNGATPVAVPAER